MSGAEARVVARQVARERLRRRHARVPFFDVRGRLGLRAAGLAKWARLGYTAGEQAPERTAARRARRMRKSRAERLD